MSTFKFSNFLKNFRKIVDILQIEKNYFLSYDIISFFFIHFFGLSDVRLLPNGCDSENFKLHEYVTRSENKFPGEDGSAPNAAVRELFFSPLIFLWVLGHSVNPINTIRAYSPIDVIFWVSEKWNGCDSDGNTITLLPQESDILRYYTPTIA